MAIIVKNPGYSNLQIKLVNIAFNTIDFIDKRNKSRHISFLVKKNKIVSIGWNKENRTHTRAVKYNYFANRIHSELACLVKFPHAPSELKKYSIYNVRFDRHNQVRLAKPCRHCIQLLDAYNIKDVLFTNDDGIFERL